MKKQSNSNYPNYAQSVVSILYKIQNSKFVLGGIGKWKSSSNLQSLITLFFVVTHITNEKVAS